jgi:NADH-quinone oxidoreductase subunit E
MNDDLNAEHAAMLADIRERLKSFSKERGNLIPILQDIQGAHAYLAPEAIGLVAAHLELPQSEIYGVATFYNQFRFNPPGRNPIKVCLGTACHVKSGDIILENFERKLEICENETTPDREFSLERVACVGCCALAPVAVVGETVHGHMAPSKVEGLIMRIRLENEMREKRKKDVPSN